jgi:aspartyl-tRNA(Asn)/glutamyl-tRNA(Gln) amidotransferase subunit B
VGDESAIRKAVDEVIKANPQSVADYKAGKKKAMGFLVGQTMRAMGGKAEPGMVNRVVQESLEKA